MATLILTTVGGAVGGPIGAAIGGLLGNGIDRTLLRPAPRQGPRLNELAVQTSSYGTQIASLFGTIRVAGTVIWATDLIESRTTEGRAKGNPGTVRYSYSVSFAVLLSARPILGVRRIWADGKLLRGAGGDFKSPTRFRLYRGDADQASDPLIASHKGQARTPAHRDHAYAVFEQFELADYGNRIPSLTFEVEADTLRDAAGIAKALSGVVSGEGDLGPELEGFSAHGGSQRAVVQMLADASGAWFAGRSDGGIVMRGDGPVERLVDDEGAAKAQRSLAAADSAPRVVTVGHYDAARDYQAGLQRAARPGPGQRERHVDLPAVIPAETAKAVAAAMVARADAARQRRRVTLDWAAFDIAPGARVSIAGEPGRWRVAESLIEAMEVKLDLTPIAQVSASAPATSGEAIGAPDRLHGPTVLVAAEIPPVDDTRWASPHVTVTAGGALPGWRRASLLASDDGGANWRVAGAIDTSGVVGRVETPPGVASAAIEDRIGAIVVLLGNDGMSLASVDATRMDRGENMAVVGDELIQFGDATPLGNGRWRLSRLWRGRRGTEWAIAKHGAGESFAVIDRDSAITLALPASAMGGTLLLAAQGIGDDNIVPVAVPISGASIVPPSPVHARRVRSHGETGLHWVRRSRAGWRWTDGSDVPLGEERERYRVTGPSGAVETGAPEWNGTLPDGPVAIVQIGDAGPSRAAIVD
ncbi:GTA baseplate fiber-binding domain-containing protein [Sphingomonas sp.]